MHPCWHLPGRRDWLFCTTEYLVYTAHFATQPAMQRSEQHENSMLVDAAHNPQAQARSESQGGPPSRGGAFGPSRGMAFGQAQARIESQGGAPSRGGAFGYVEDTELWPTKRDEERQAAKFTQHREMMKAALAKANYNSVPHLGSMPRFTQRGRNPNAADPPAAGRNPFEQVPVDLVTDPHTAWTRKNRTRPSVTSRPAKRRHVSGKSNLIVGFLNAGGGMNPLEFVTTKLKPLDDKFKEFLTTNEGLVKFESCFAETQAAPGMATWTDLMVGDASYLVGKKAALAKLDASSRDKVAVLIRGKEPKAYQGNREAAKTDKFQPTIFNLVAVGDAAGDFDGENKLQENDCIYRFNPLNRSTTTCETTVDADDADFGTAKENKPWDPWRAFRPPAEHVSQFHRAMKIIRSVPKAEAFKTLCRMASKRFLAFRIEHEKNNREDHWHRVLEGEDIKQYGDTRGVLFYDIYTAYFLCYVLDENDQKSLSSHFDGYLGDGLCIDASHFVQGCDVVGFAEFDEKKNKVTDTIGELGTLVKYSPDDEKLAIAIGPCRAGHSPIVLDPCPIGWVNRGKTAGETMRTHLVDSLNTVGLGLEKEEPLEPGQKGLNPGEKERKKAREGIKKLFKKMMCTSVKMEGTASTANLVVVHGKEYAEVPGVASLVGPVNAIMGGEVGSSFLDSPRPANATTDVLMGDLNCTFAGSPKFFAAVRQRYKDMQAKLEIDIANLDDDDEAQKAALTASSEAFAAASAFLLNAKVTLPAKKKAASKKKEHAASGDDMDDLDDDDEKDDEDEMDEDPVFDKHIGIVPMATVTTDKTRGYTSIQPKKVGKHVSECKDFVFYDMRRLRYVSHNVFPRPGESHAVDVLRLNTGLWPYDHAAVTATFEPVLQQSGAPGATATCH